ncbi:MAG: glycoside hydrolase family 5 protein [Treponema sp.]|jgi:endoglucanase|nr:glycoside hydrolase family 5 protein [Treponema sp.]
MPTVIPFSKGVNFSKWFESRTFNDIVFDKFTEQDFADLKSLGGDVIRLPVAFHNFTLGDKKHTLEPELLKYLDTVLDWAEKYQIYLIVDNHSFHPVNPTDVNIDKILIPVWEQVAKRYKNRSSYLIYEILNEPHGISDERWGKIQLAAIKAIRKIDKEHIIIVGGINYNSIEKLFSIPVYKEKNLLYTFHFYDPHIFTHQGATWNKPSLAPLSGLPFPGAKESIPPIHETFKGTWVEVSLNNYEHDSKLSVLSATLDKVSSFSKERNASVFCGEFGVFMNQSPAEDRIKWYKFICEEFAKRNITWTCWDYFGGFGLFNKAQGRAKFPEELNTELVKTIGFKC